MTAQLKKKKFAAGRYAGTLFLISGCMLIPEVVTAKTIRVGIYEASPKSYVDSNSVPRGIFVDVLEDIAKKEDWRLEYVPGTLTVTENRLEESDIDLMAAVNFTEERAAKYSFNQIPVLTDWPLVYRKPEVTIDGIRDLQQKRIGVLKGSIYKTILSQVVSANHIECRILDYNDNSSVARALNNSHIDGIFASRFLVHGSYFSNVVTVAFGYLPVMSYFAVKKGAGEGLLKAIDRRLAVLINDSSSEYYRSLKHWLEFRRDDVISTAASGIIVFIAVGAVGFLLTTLLLILTTRTSRKARGRKFIER